MPNPREVATVIIRGQRFEDWETVWVHLEFPSRWRSFRLSVSEGNPMAKSFNDMQIKPGDVCQIILAGQSVITAYVLERQAYYDAERHSVMISGQSKVSDLSKTSVETDKIGGGQFQKMTLEQIAKRVTQPFGIGVTTRGNSEGMSLPFDNAQVQTSESPYHFIERLSRMRSTFLADDKDGNLVLDGGGDFSDGPALVEGQNIKWARLTANDTELMNNQVAVGQAQATDSAWGRKNNQSKFSVPGPMNRYKPFWFLAPRALGPEAMMQELKLAAQFEAAWRLQTALRVEVGVQGWVAPGGGLWDIQMRIPVFSPMLPITESLVSQQVTFSQSNEQGTNTVLELVNSVAMNPGQPQLG